MLHLWRRAGLRVHLILPAAFALGVVVLAFVAISVHALESSIQQSMEERLALARVMAHQVDVQLDHARVALQDAAKPGRMNLEDGNLEPEKKVLDSIYQDCQFFRSVILLDVHGVILWQEPRVDSMIGVNLLQPPYSIPPPSPGAPAFIRQTSVSNKTPGVIVRYAIESSDGGIVGYLFGWMDAANPASDSLLYPYQPGGGGSADLIDGQGVVLASTSRDRIGRVDDHGGYISSLIRDRHQATGTCHSCHDSIGNNRQDEAYAFAPLSIVPWGVVLRQPSEEILASARSLAYELAALGLVVLAAFLGLVSFTARGVANPLRLLSDACHRIAAGDLSHHIPLMGIAETSALASSFEEMRRRLLEYRTQTEGYNRELEQRVEERTADLAISNLQLEQSRDYLLKANRNLTALNSVAAIVSQSLDLGDMLGATLDRVLHAVAEDTGGIFLRNAHDETLDLSAYRGIPDEQVRRISRLSRSDLLSDSVGPVDSRTWSDACLRELRVRTGLDSLIVVPMEANQEFLGCIFVASARTGRLAQEEAGLLVSIAWQVAVAVRNIHSYSALRAEEKARRDLLRRILNVQEEERRRIARELHDETCQTLTALMVGLDTTRLALAVGTEAATTRLDATKAMASDILGDIRRLVADLRPSLLDDLGLAPAILWYGEQRLRPLGIDLHVEASGLQQRLPAAIETALFRIAQEAISNVVKHAQASAMSILIQRTNDRVIMTVEDNGKGFQSRRNGVIGSVGHGLGLRGMQERASALGGDLSVRSGIGRGTRLTIWMPVLEVTANEEDHRSVSR